ncbi:MAG: hypothetical protein AB1817_11950 [Chloroflexota bacterium]
MDLQLHFTEDDWARIGRDWSAWWAGELPRPLVMIEEFAPPWNDRGINIHNLGDLIINLPGEMSADQVLDFYQERLEAKHFYGDAFPKWKLTFGPGIAAGFLGARVNPTPDTVWFDPVEQVNIENLHLTYSADNPWWQRVRALTHRAVERWGNRVCIAHTDIGGNFDILASFCTSQQLLLDLYDHPADVARLIGEITRAWIRYYDELDTIIGAGKRGTTPWAPIWSPGRCYMLQSDFSYMISPEMFERFVLPDLSACCDVLDHAFYHMDGKGQIRHLDLLLSLKRLHGIQWIPGDGAPPPQGWLSLLKRIRDGGKLCQLFVAPEGARRIVKALGGRGFAFYIERQMSQKDAHDFLRLLESEDKSSWS